MLQFATDVRNARADSIEATIGTSPTLRIFTGGVPANTDAANTGTILATLPLPADWMQAASGGTKTMAGTWRDNEADAAGIAGHFRMYTSAGVCKMQGTVGLTGSSEDMKVDNVNFQPGQEFTITGFTLIEPHA